MAEDGPQVSWPQQAIHPGRYVADELDDLGWSCRDLAERIGRSARAIDRVLRGRAPITQPLANDFEVELGLSAAVLRGLQQRYDETIEHLADEPSMCEDVALLPSIPWRQFLKQGWIRDVGTAVERVCELRVLYDVDSLSGIENSRHATAFRISRNTDVDAWALAAWVQEGLWQALDRRKARGYRVFSSFDAETFEAKLPSFRSLTREERFWPAMRQLCADSGIALEFVPNVPKSGANGVTHWIEEDRPLIQLSLFRKRADIFWFTFFHEAGHLLLHEPDDFFINLDERRRTDEKERQADSFAADCLIPPEKFQRFVALSRFDDESIIDFADSIGIHPGIVVGRMQNDKILDRRWRNHLKVSYAEDVFVD